MRSTAPSVDCQLYKKMYHVLEVSFTGCQNVHDIVCSDGQVIP